MSVRENTTALRALLDGAGLGDQAGDMLDAIKDFARFFAIVLERNKDTAPNYITINFETDDASVGYELTIRKHGGTSPADKIAALERECERLRRRLADMPVPT